MNTGCVYLIGAGCGPAGFGPLGLWLVAGRRGFGRAAGLAFRRFAGGGCAGYAVALRVGVCMMSSPCRYGRDA